MFRFSLLVVVGLASIIGSFWLIDGDWPLLLVKYGGYWVMLYTVLVFTGSIIFWMKGKQVRVRAALLEHRWALFLAMFGIFVITMLQGFQFKVVMDELVVASTSMNLHLDKTILTVSRGYEVEGVFHLLGGYLDKRPYFFAFVVSLLHDLTGYRPENAFALNVASGFLTLCGVYGFGVLVGGKKAGYLGMILLLGLPLFGVNVTCGGIELLNIVMILATSFFAIEWLKKSDSLNFTLLVYSAVLLAQARYESILFVVPTAIIVIWGWWRAKRIILPWTGVVVPVLLIPYVLQHRVFSESGSLLELKSGQQGPFGFDYLQGNIESLVHYFFSVSDYQILNSILISGLVMLSVVGVVFQWKDIRGWFSGDKKEIYWVLGGFCLIVVFNLFLVMFYFWGQVSDPMASRFALPITVYMILFVVLCFSKCRFFRIIYMPVILGAVFFVFYHTVPYLQAASYMRGMYGARRIDWLQDESCKLNGVNLWVSNAFFINLINEESGIPVNTAVDRKVELCLLHKLGYFDHIYVVYNDVMDDRGEVRALEAGIHEAFQLKEVGSCVLGPDAVVKIGEISEVNLSSIERDRLDQLLLEYRSVDMQDSVARNVLFAKWLP